MSAVQSSPELAERKEGPASPGSSGATHAGRRLVRNILTLGFSQGVSWIGGLVLTIVMPRYLGDTNLGKFAFAFSLTTLVALIANLGINSYVTKQVARDPSRTPQLVTSALALRVPIGCAAAIATIVGVNLTGYDAVTKHTVFVLSAGIVLTSLDVATGALQGLQRMKPIALAGALNTLVYAALATGVLIRGGGPTELALTWIGACLTYQAICYAALLRSMRIVVPFSLSACKVVLLGGLPFFIWQASSHIYGQIDVVLLGILSQPNVTGWYAVAYRIVAIPAVVPAIVVTVVFPALTAASWTSDTFNALARRSVHLITVASLPMALGVLLLADRVIDLLHYPPSFRNAVVPLILLSLHVPLVGIDMIIGAALNACDRQRQWAIIAVAAAVINPALNLIAIPLTQTVYGNAAIGAAAVTTITEVFIMCAGLWLLGPGVFGRATLAGIVRIAISGLAMSLVVLAVRSQPVVIPIGLGAATYLISTFATGALGRQDLRDLWHVVSEGRRRNGDQPDEAPQDHKMGDRGSR